MDPAESVQRRRVGGSQLRGALEETEEVVTNDPLELEPQVVDREMRFPSIGITSRGRWLFVVSTVRNDKIRITTAYNAPKQLIESYLRSRD